MGLKDFKGGVDEEPGVRNKVEKLDNPLVCPSCGEEADLLPDRYYDRCRSEGCDTLTFTRTSYRIDYNKHLK